MAISFTEWVAKKKGLKIEDVRTGTPGTYTIKPNQDATQSAPAQHTESPTTTTTTSTTTQQRISPFALSSGMATPEMAQAYVKQFTPVPLPVPKRTSVEVQAELDKKDPGFHMWAALGSGMATQDMAQSALNAYPEISALKQEQKQTREWERQNLNLMQERAMLGQGAIALPNAGGKWQGYDDLIQYAQSKPGELGAQDSRKVKNAILELRRMAGLSGNPGDLEYFMSVSPQDRETARQYLLALSEIPLSGAGNKIENFVTSAGANAIGNVIYFGETVGQAARNAYENLTNEELQKEYQTFLGGMYSGDAKGAQEAIDRAKGLRQNKAVDVDSLGSQILELGQKEAYKMTYKQPEPVKLLGEAALSTVNYLGTLAIAGGNPMAALGLMGVQSFANTAYDVAKKGGTMDEQLVAGIVSGLIEMATEKLPLDSLMKIVKGNSKGLLKWLTDLVKQSGIEAVEEGVNYGAGYLANKLILGGLADEFDIEEMFRQMAIGGLSGGFMGAGAGVVSRAGNTGTQNTAQTQAQTQPVPLPIADPNDPIAQRIRGQGQAAQSIDMQTQAQQGHTPQMQKTIAEYQNSVDENLVEFARQVNQSVNEGKNVNWMNYELSEVKQREAQDIKKAVGVDTTGFTHNIKGNTIVHISRRHGENGRQDSSMADIKNIGRIQYVLDNYDSVEQLVGKKGKPEKSGEFRNADSTPANMVQYKKRIDGTFYLVEAVPDTKRRQVQVVTAYIQPNKKDGASQVLNMPQSDPQLTSEPPVASTPSTQSIPQAGIGVNSLPNDMQPQGTQSTPVPLPIARPDDPIAQAIRQGQTQAGTQQTQREWTQAEAKRYRGMAYLTNDFIRQAKDYGMLDAELEAINKIAKETKTLIAFDENAPQQGMYQNGKITINPRAKDPIVKILTHELTHFAQTGKGYVDLRKDVLESQYLGELLGMSLEEARRTVQSRYQTEFSAQQIINPKVSLEELTDREVFAQAMGSLIYNENALTDIAKKRPAFIQSVIDFFGRLADKIKGTGGYERFAKDVQNRFQKALYDAKAQDGDVQFSIGYTVDNTPFVTVDRDILQGKPQQDWVKVVKDNLRKRFPNGVTVGNNEIKINPITRREMTYSEYMKRVYRKSPQIYADKLRATDNVDEILKASRDYVNEAPLHPRKDNITDFARGNVLIRVGSNDYNAEVIVGTKRNGDMILYDIINLKPEQIIQKDKKISDTVLYQPISKETADRLPVSDNDNVTQNESVVNSYTMQDDENYPQKSLDMDAQEMDAQMEDLIERYGAIPQGENPAREVKVPRRIDEDYYNSFAVRTMMEAGITPDEILNDVKDRILKGDFAHEVFTDAQAKAYAEDYIDRYGINESVRNWRSRVDNEKAMNKNDIAVGQALLNQMYQLGDAELALELMTELANEATRAGQVVQAQKMLKQLTPPGKLYALEKSLRQINRELYQRYKEAAPKVEINRKLAMDLLNAKTQEAQNKAVEAIKDHIGEQMPVDWFEKWNAWRYVSMLFNPRTHIRNILGNAVFMPARAMKNAVGAGIEGFSERMGWIEQSKRTKAFIMPVFHSSEDTARLDFAKMYFDANQDSIKGESKYSVGTDLQSRRRIFDNKALEWIRKTNFNTLEAEDLFFLRKAYISSFAQAMKARGVTPQFLNGAGKVARETLENINAYATQEALKATYRDANALASALNNLKRKNKAGEVFIGGLVPFTKTPTNIARRGIEYSPAELIKVVVNDARKVRQGRMDATEMINNLSTGLTGSGVLALGMFLASQGLISGGGEDDRKEQAFERLRGGQNYALKIGNKSYTIDWMSPVCLPLFVGVELWDGLQEGKEGLTFREIADSITKIIDPMFEMTMLQGINSTFKSVQGQENPLGGIAVNAIENFVSQAVPSVLGAAARTIDGTRRRTYYDDKTNPLHNVIQTMGRKAAAKIPFASMLLQPSIDEWGRQDVEGNAGMRFVENFLSPGYIGEWESSKMEDELQRLYDTTGEKSVLPTTAAKYFNVGERRFDLSYEDYKTYAQKLGKTRYQLITDMVDSSLWRDLDDEQKVQAIEKAYEYSNAVAKEAVSDYKSKDEWIEQAKNTKKMNMTTQDYMINLVKYGGVKGVEKAQKLNNAGLGKSSTDKVFFALDKLEPLPGKDAVNNQQKYRAVVTSGLSDKEQVAAMKVVATQSIYEKVNVGYQFNVKPADYVNYREWVEQLDDNGSVTQKEAQAALDRMKLSNAQKAVLWQLQDKRWKPYNNPYSSSIGAQVYHRLN